MKDSRIVLMYKNLAQSKRYGDIVFFQNPASKEIKIYPYHIIHECPYEWTHPFSYDRKLDLVIRDAFGNIQIKKNVMKGQLYTFTKDRGFVKDSDPIEAEKIEIQNGQVEGSISVGLLRSGRLLYEKTEICPDEYVSLDITEDLYVGRFEEIGYKQELDPRILRRCMTKINMSEVENTLLTLRGGGFGEKAKKFYMTTEPLKS